MGRREKIAPAPEPRPPARIFTTTNYKIYISEYKMKAKPHAFLDKHFHMHGGYINV